MWWEHRRNAASTDLPSSWRASKSLRYTQMSQDKVVTDGYRCPRSGMQNGALQPAGRRTVEYGR